MIWGSQLERYVFYDERPNAVEIPLEVLNSEGHRKGKAYTEWAKETRRLRGLHVQLLKGSEWNARLGPASVIEAGGRVNEVKAAERLVMDRDSCDYHPVFQWTDEETGLPLKAQLDILRTDGLIVDLKSATSVSPEDFVRAIRNFGYHIQAWWYREAVRIATGDTLPFVLVVVQNSPSYKLAIYDLDDSWYQLAEASARAWLKDLALAMETNDWRAPNEGCIVTLSPPRWAWNDEWEIE
jgi:hypothetical protein